MLHASRNRERDEVGFESERVGWSELEITSAWDRPGDRWDET